MEIILGKARRRWSEARRREIVAETMADGVTVTSVALRHGVSRSMLFSWRRRLVGESGSKRARPAFVPVTMKPTPEVAQAPSTLEVAFTCGVRLRVAGAVDPTLVAEIVKALTRA